MISQSSETSRGQVDAAAPVVVPFPIPSSDTGLVAALRAEHPQARAAICERYSEELLRIATRLMGPNTRVNGLVAETIQRALECLDELTDPRSLRIWLLSQLLAAAQRTLRAQRRWRWLGGDHAEVRFDRRRFSEPHLSTYSLLGRLSVEERVVFCLVVIHWMGPAEAAATLGVSSSAVKDRLAAAHAKFGRLARSSCPRLMQRYSSHAALGAKIAREQDRILGCRRIDESELPHSDAPPRRQAYFRGNQVCWILATALLMVAFASVAAAWLAHSRSAQFQVQGEVMLPAELTRLGRWVVAPPQTRKSVSFSDGSSITLAPGSRMRILGVNRRGSSSVLESGAATLSMVYSGRAEYLVAAGPFVLRLSNGQVELAWDSTNETLEVAVNQGDVALIGCQFGAGHSMMAGKSIRTRCRAQ
jgi:DNA-directed RNA polymerase specialized sigma24 family protein